MRIYFQRKCMRILREFYENYKGTIKEFYENYKGTIKEFYKNYKGIIKEFYKNSIEFYGNSAGILLEFTGILWKCCKKMKDRILCITLQKSTWFKVWITKIPKINYLFLYFENQMLLFYECTEK